LLSDTAWRMESRISDCDSVHTRVSEFYWLEFVNKRASSTDCESISLDATLATVIQSFAHKGLARFYQTGGKSGIQAKHAELIRLISPTSIKPMVRRTWTYLGWRCTNWRGGGRGLGP